MRRFVAELNSRYLFYLKQTQWKVYLAPQIDFFFQMENFPFPLFLHNLLLQQQSLSPEGKQAKSAAVFMTTNHSS